MRFAVDTNVLVYAERLERDPDDAAKIELTGRLISRLDPAALVVPAQVLGELYNVLTRRGSVRPADARQAVEEWSDIAHVVATNGELIASAADLAARHRLAIWDAVVLAAAAEARCDLLLSEDMQAGFVWRGVEVVNPFLPDPHPVLAGLLAA
ncbi:MAG: PIN domain-containing protein [Alphaproteobacteria bacterium]|nr:PIN domain-containing protein [Alphaproteobacteria bacterium]